MAGASVTLETGKIAGRALEEEEELTLGHVGLEVLDIRSQGAQEVWVPGENASLEGEGERESATGKKQVSQVTGAWGEEQHDSESPKTVFLLLNLLPLLGNSSPSQTHPGELWGPLMHVWGLLYMNLLLELDLCCQGLSLPPPAHCGPPRTQSYA